MGYPFTKAVVQPFASNDYLLKRFLDLVQQETVAESGEAETQEIQKPSTNRVWQKTVSAIWVQYLEI